MRDLRNLCTPLLETFPNFLLTHEVVKPEDKYNSIFKKIERNIAVITQPGGSNIVECDGWSPWGPYHSLLT